MTEKHNCPKCGCWEHSKNGFAKGLQRYKCKNCGYNYTVERKSDVKPEKIRRLALHLYLEGLGFRSIGRVLSKLLDGLVSYGTVYSWVKKYGEETELPVQDNPIEVMELDELHTYVGKKKLTAGSGLLLIDMESGSPHLFVGTDLLKQLKSSGKKSAD
jgi:transposase-like protein